MALNCKILGTKVNTFVDKDGKTVEFAKIALDIGSTIKVYNVKIAQRAALERLVVGDYLTDADIVLANDICVFIKGVY